MPSVRISRLLHPGRQREGGKRGGDKNDKTDPLSPFSMTISSLGGCPSIYSTNITQRGELCRSLWDKAGPVPRGSRERLVRGSAWEGWRRVEQEECPSRGPKGGNKHSQVLSATEGPSVG